MHIYNLVTFNICICQLVEYCCVIFCYAFTNYNFFYSIESSANASTDLYCTKSGFLPLRTVCIHISTLDSIASYHSAQFDVCGKQKHSDLIVFSLVSWLLVGFVIVSDCEQLYNS